MKGHLHLHLLIISISIHIQGVVDLLGTSGCLYQGLIQGIGFGRLTSARSGGKYYWRVLYQMGYTFFCRKLCQPLHLWAPAQTLRKATKQAPCFV